MWLSASAVACKDGTIRSGLTIKIIIVMISTKVIEMTTSRFNHCFINTKVILITCLFAISLR